jgi:hypothetical protein
MTGLRGGLLAGLLCLPCVTLAQILPDPAPSHLPEAPPAIDPAKLSDAELLDLLAQIEARRAPPPWRVGLFGANTAFVLPRGYGFVAGAATNRRDRRFPGDWDASLALGAGFGDADLGVGVMPVIDVTSVSPHHFGSSGKIGVKFSRNLAFPGAWQAAVSLDLQNLLTWGDANVLDPGWSVAFSAVHPGGGRPVLLTAGAGSAVAGRGSDEGLFGGIGVALAPRAAASLSWFGDEAIAGLILWPEISGLWGRNLQLLAGVGDITDRVDGRRLLLGVSIAGPMNWFK